MHPWHLYSSLVRLWCDAINVITKIRKLVRQGFLAKPAMWARKLDMRAKQRSAVWIMKLSVDSKCCSSSRVAPRFKLSFCEPQAFENLHR